MRDKNIEQNAFQDLMVDNHCFGCGPNNADGLRIKSYWAENDTTICEFIASVHHCAAPLHFVNGGIVSTIIDCHSVCSAIAMAYKNENREIGQGAPLIYATGKLDVSFMAPTPLGKPLLLTAKFIEVKAKKIILDCTLLADGIICARANVIAVKVPSNWSN